MEQLKLQGCGTALITPFKNEEVDYKAFEKLVKFQIESGVHFLVPLGTTGETPCLMDKERIQILQIAKPMLRGALLWWASAPTHWL